MPITDTQNLLLQQAAAQQGNSSGSNNSLADSLIRSGLTSATRNTTGALVREGLYYGLPAVGLAAVGRRRSTRAAPVAANSLPASNPINATLTQPESNAWSAAYSKYSQQGMNNDAAAVAARDEVLAARVATPTGAAAGAAGTGAAGGILGMGPVMTAGTVGAAGLIGGSLIDQFNIGGENSRLDKGLSDAARGAGIGGAVGTLVPIPGVGTGVGALVGAGIGALWGSLTGDHDSPKTKFTKTSSQIGSTVDQLASQLGISNGSALQNVRDQVLALTTTYATNKDWKGGVDALKYATSQLPTLLLNAKTEQQRQDQYNQRVMVMQQAFAPMFKSITDNTMAGNRQLYEAQVNAADQLAQTNPQLAASTKQIAAATQTSQDALMAAYAAQIAQAPGADQYTQNIRSAAQSNMQPIGRQ